MKPRAKKPQALSPLSRRQRESRYLAQTGRKALTRRQEKRVAKAEGRAVLRSMLDAEGSVS